MNTKFTREAGELDTQDQLTRILIEKLESAHPGSPEIEILSPVDVTEGREDCGSGPLHISGIFRAGKRAFGADVPGYIYRIDATGSRWRNYGAPHGTKYDVVVNLVCISAQEAAQ